MINCSIHIILTTLYVWNIMSPIIKEYFFNVIFFLINLFFLSFDKVDVNLM